MKRIKSLADLLNEGALGAQGEANTFSALEILETAELIERKEGNLYRKAGIIWSDGDKKP
jgi:hypothetical protein